MASTGGTERSAGRAKAPEGITVQEFRGRLRCSRCGGSRETSLRIVYAGAGGFHHGG